MITFKEKYDNIIIGDSVKKDNELKMKEILDELEVEIDERLQDNEEISEKELTEVIEENIIDEKEENNELEEEIIEDEIIDEDITDESEEEKIEEEDEKEFVVKSSIAESDIKKIGDYIIESILKYKYVVLLDFAVFLLLFFLIPQIMFEVKPYIWMTLFLIFTLLPTMAFYVKNKFKDKQIMFGFIFYFVCMLCILEHCTLNDLYGITSHGTLDKTPAWLDALFVTFIIVFFQYLGILVINLMKKLRKKKTRK